MKLKLLIVSLFLFGMASAQAPKIKHVYKSVTNVYQSGKEEQTVTSNIRDYSPTGKLFTEKKYIQGKEEVVDEYYYNKKDSLTRITYTGFLVETDSTIYNYSTNYDTVKVSDYYKGKAFRELFTTYYKNGKKCFERQFYTEDSSGFAAKYDSSGKVISIINNNKGIKYDLFGNMLQYQKDGTTIYWKYSSDGKELIEEEVIPDDKSSSYKTMYFYNNNGKIIKEVGFSNGYLSTKNGKNKMIYSDSTIRTYTYDSQNNRTTEYLYGNGKQISQEIFYTYDKDNRLIKEVFCKTTGVCADTTVYTYDKYGNILEEAHYKGMNNKVLDWKFVYTYDFY